MVATVIVTLVSFNNADRCGSPDCDDSAREEAVGRVIILLPISVLLGAAGVALVHDTYRKV